MLRRALWWFGLKCNDIMRFEDVYMHGAFSVGLLLVIVMC